MTVTSAHGSPTQVSQWVNAGSSFTVSVTNPDVVDAGHHWNLTGLTLDAVPQTLSNSVTLTNVQAAHAVVFSWTEQFYVTVTQGANGLIAPGTTTVNYGGSQTFTITPNTGYHIASLTVDGSAVTVASSYTFSNVQATHTITATFAINTYTISPITVTNTFTISASAGANGTISPTGSVSVNYGDNQSFTITASGGYHIANVIVDNVPQGAVSSYNFTNVTASHTITASFGINTNTTTTVIGIVSNTTIIPITQEGNIAVQQFLTNVTITPHPSNITTTVAFTVTGPSGTLGFSNMTLPKTSIPYGTTPLVYINGTLAPDQGYTQDSINYYVWYTIHFSTHEVLIVFTTASSSSLPLEAIYGIAVAVAIVAIVAVVLVLRKSKKGKS